MSNVTGWASSNKINWDDESDAPPPTADEGIYLLQFSSAEPEATKKGEAAVSVVLEILEKRDGSDLGRCNRNIYDKLSFSEKGRFRVKNLCKSGGYEPPTTDSQQDVGEFAARLVEGGPVWAKVKHQQTNGKVYCKVDRFLTEEESHTASSGDSSGSFESSPAVAGGRRRRS